MDNRKQVRQQVLVNGLSPRAASEKHKPGWHTLKRILAHPEPFEHRQSRWNHGITDDSTFASLVPRNTVA